MAVSSATECPATKRQRLLADLVDVLEVLAEGDEPGLLPGQSGDVAEREEVAPVQPAGEVEDARAAHDGVVDVEERRPRSGRAAAAPARSRLPAWRVRHRCGVRRPRRRRPPADGPRRAALSGSDPGGPAVRQRTVPHAARLPRSRGERAAWSGPDRGRITLIGKPGCHLCDDARAVVARVGRGRCGRWQELSILDDPALCADVLPSRSRSSWSTASSTTSGGSTRRGCAPPSRRPADAAVPVTSLTYQTSRVLRDFVRSFTNDLRWGDPCAPVPPC